MSASYHLIANTFLAVGGLVIAIFIVGGALALLLHLYLAFEGFVASQMHEDALGYRPDRNGPALPRGFHIPEHVDVSSSFGGN